MKSDRIKFFFNLFYACGGNSDVEYVVDAFDGTATSHEEQQGGW